MFSDVSDVFAFIREMQDRWLDFVMQDEVGPIAFSSRTIFFLDRGDPEALQRAMQQEASQMARLTAHLKLPKERSTEWLQPPHTAPTACFSPARTGGTRVQPCGETAR